MRLALAILFAALPAMADTISGHVLIDFETGTHGDTITAAVMSNSMAAASIQLGDWSTQNGAVSAESPGATPNLKIDTNAQFTLRTPADIDGTIYDGTGTRGMRATLISGQNNAVRLTMNTALPNMSIGFYFRWNGPCINWAPRDVVLFQDSGGNFQALQCYDQCGVGQVPYMHTHQQGSPGTGDDVNIAFDTWYWVTIYRAKSGEQIRIRFYEAENNYNMLAESDANVPAGTGSINWFTFGGFKYGYTGQSMDFDNMIINTNGTFPLGPGNGALIPDTRKVEWGRQTVGMPNGIPYRTTVNDVISDTDDLQTAINACAVGEVLVLTNGVWDLVGSGVTINKSITLRGQNPYNTIIIYGDAGGNGIDIASGDITSAVDYNLLSGYVKGSSNVVLAAVPDSLNVGYIVRFDQSNDNSGLVFDTGNNGKQTTISRDAGDRVLAHDAMVMAIDNSTNLTIWPPFPWTLTASLDPEIYYWKSSSSTNNYVMHVGIENLTLTNAYNDNGSKGLRFAKAAQCWVSNVWLRQGYTFQVSMEDSFRNEIRYSMVEGTWTNANGQGYGINLDKQSSWNLIEDNIFANHRQFVQVNGGGVGNAVLYNYMTNATAGAAPQFTVKTGGHHNPHAMMNLWEGNVIYKFTGDFTYGSSSHNTIFRNWCKALMDYSSQSGTAFEMDWRSVSNHIVGNIVGYTNITAHSGFTTWYNHRVSPTNMVYNDDFASFRVGYNSSSDTGSFGREAGTQWENYIITHNWEWVTEEQTAYNGASLSETLVDSYFYDAEPGWWHANAVWPPIDPAVPMAMTETNLPAGIRWVHGDGQGPAGGDPDPPTTAPGRGLGPSRATRLLGALAPGPLQNGEDWMPELGTVWVSNASAGWVPVMTFLDHRHPDFDYDMILEMWPKWIWPDEPLDVYVERHEK